MSESTSVQTHRNRWGDATAFFEEFRRRGWFDLLLLAGCVGAILGLISLAGEWRTLRPAVRIDLAPSVLPLYVFYSKCRGLLAYVISLAFTLTYGYWAAKVVGISSSRAITAAIMRCTSAGVNPCAGNVCSKS